MSTPLEGRVALVAGGTRAAGRGTAAELGALGATVYVTGRTTRTEQSEMNRPETIEETAELVDAAGGCGIAVRRTPERRDVPTPLIPGVPLTCGARTRSTAPIRHTSPGESPGDARPQTCGVPMRYTAPIRHTSPGVPPEDARPQTCGVPMRYTASIRHTSPGVPPEDRPHTRLGAAVQRHRQRTATT